MSSAGQRRTLAGRYRLGEVLGRGGMSTVYRATDLSLDREVAVKVAMDPLLESDPIYAARFKREARAAAALSHPGVVTVFDAGADGPTRYIVMECVAGRSLAQILRDERPLEPPRAARIAEQIADTLSAAHAAGIVHRDIKPGNVMVAEGGAPASGGATTQDQVKLLDFGIARTADAVTLTQTASVLGTAPYMAPEQAMGNPADARSDIYSLGCVLYEMLTGEPPFMADVPAAVLHQHVRVPVTPPAQRNPAVPPALDALVVQMLAKKPEDRPQTAAEVRERLASFETGAPTDPTVPLAAAGAATAATAATEVLASAAAAAAVVPQVATVPQPASVPPQAASVSPQAPRATQPPPPSRKKSAGPWAFLAVVALLLLGGAVAYALASGGGANSPTSTASHSSVPATSSSHAPTSSTAQHSNSSPSSTSTPSSSSSSSTSTTTTTTTATTPTTPTTTLSTPPGQGGTPPGQAKKGDGNAQ